MDGARERGEGGSEQRRGEQRSKGGRKGGRDGGKLQGRYPEEDTGQYTVHKSTHNEALALETLVLQMKNSEQVYKLCIMMRGNVLFDRWMT